MSMKQLVNTTKAYPAFAPVDINGAGADGDWVHFGHWKRIKTIIITASLGGTSNLTFQQASDNAGTGAKTLGFTTLKRNAAYTTDDARSDVAVTSDSHAMLTATGTLQVIEVEHRASELDVAGGFTHMRVRLSDPSAAALVAAIYEFGDPAYPSVERDAID